MKRKVTKSLKSTSKSKKAIVYEELKNRIIHNLLKPGEPLNEGVLSEEFKISKTPIREALQQLEREGFIENIPVKGAFVSQMSIQDLRELFDLREILECEVIKRAAIKVDPEAAEELKERFISLENNGKGGNGGRFKSGDEIHSFIFETYGNHRLLEIYKRLQEHIVRSRIHFFHQSNPSHPDRTEESFREHLEILEALKTKDPSRAEQAMRTHLRNSMEFLKKVI